MTASQPTKFRLTPYRPIEVPDLVRVGRPHDGGYVTCAQAIDRTKLLISGGICIDWSFEYDFLSRARSSRLLAFDGSISGWNFFRNAVIGFARALHSIALLRKASFKFHLGGALFTLRLAGRFLKFFYAPGRHFVKRFLSVVDSRKTMSWNTIRRMPLMISVEKHEFSICWKLDIEGSEFKFLPTILRDARLFNSLIVEFHDLDAQWNDFESLMQVVTRDFAVIHIHGNNCAPLVPDTSCPSVLEVTFLNRALLPAVVAHVSTALPRAGLDFPNRHDRADHPIGF